MKHLRVAILVAAVCMPASALAGARADLQGRPRHAEGDRCLAAADPERMGASGADAHDGLEKLSWQPAHARTHRRPRKTGARGPAPIGGGLHRRTTRRDGVSAGIALRSPRAAADQHRIGGPREGGHGPRRLCLRRDALSRSDAVGQRGARPNGSPNPPGVPIFSPNAEPRTRRWPRRWSRRWSRRPSRARPTPGAGSRRSEWATAVEGPAPAATAPLVTARPGVIPVPPPPPRP